MRTLSAPHRVTITSTWTEWRVNADLERSTELHGLRVWHDGDAEVRRLKQLLQHQRHLLVLTTCQANTHTDTHRPADIMTQYAVSGRSLTYCRSSFSSGICRQHIWVLTKHSRTTHIRKYGCVVHLTHFNGHFAVKPTSGGCPMIFFLQLLLNRTFTTDVASFNRLTPNQQH